ncbi:hypothetical protein GCM10010215_39970 [Streptomyces virginiae]|uniref:Uncharacterized protein n=1 Tax=Streptomyces virginiae TaxID=1961 RepID=A0ABQ3NZI6_STRVG|nr:hypothetical protein [Streptomyces virginiae]MBP2343800.1 hypothetical protein [Streptomyces virginiae]GGQ10937.1 hypothetical protein GCM10010215_39970 [Streptomyces virginiae]GHI18192.1 hypothetical protein Scinn_76550 [Streptomyces virginiae]
MNERKRTRRGRVQRAVGSEAQPSKRVYKIKPKPAAEPKDPDAPKRTRKPHIKRKRKRKGAN